MNKHQLASTIWESANQMRSKIEANEYKDFILGFIFYKYLSERELDLFQKEKLSEDEIKKVDEKDVKYAKHVRETLGYFIAYDNLFSTWLAKGNDFDVKDVRDALSDFDQNIDEVYKKVFEKIFNTLQTGLSKLGETSGSQTKAVKKLLKLIKKIPMDGKQDYDVLGFIYEYLISNFAANAGKKAGEFYTPHEILQDVESEEINDLNKYMTMPKKEQLAFIKTCTDVDWDVIEKNKDGSCKKPSLTSRIQQLKMEYEFPEDSYERKLLSALRLSDEESTARRSVKQKKEALHIKTKKVIEGLSEDEALQIVEQKWIAPFVSALDNISSAIITDVINKMDYLALKYSTTMHDIQSEKTDVKSSLSEMIGMLSADGSDSEGLMEFQKILGGYVR